LNDTDPLTYSPDLQRRAPGEYVSRGSGERSKLVIQELKKLGVKPALSLRPKRPRALFFPTVGRAHVLVMTVEPGFGGQPFMADMLPKIRKFQRPFRENWIVLLRGRRNQRRNGPEGPVEAGSGAVRENAIFNAADPLKALKELKLSS